MPKDLDEIEDMDTSSSSVSALDAAADTALVDAAAANSSAATDETDEGILSVVRDVVAERKAEPEPAASSADGEEDVGEPADGEAPKGPDDEDYTDVPFNKHPRFQHLLRENKANKADAEQHRKVQNFLDSSGLAASEAADGLQIMALAKTQPGEAWKRIKPWVQKVLIAAGEVLPDDLSQRVAAGELTKEVAQELSRTRATNQSHETQRTFEQQQTERRQQTETVNSVRNAAADWEVDRRLKDPNFEAKFAPLQREVAFLHATEGKPKDAAGVKDQLKRAYAAVNAQVATVVPVNPQQKSKPAITPIGGGSVAAGNVRSEPKTFLDIVKLNRRSRA